MVSFARDTLDNLSTMVATDVDLLCVVGHCALDCLGLGRKNWNVQRFACLMSLMLVTESFVFPAAARLGQSYHQKIERQRLEGGDHYVRFMAGGDKFQWIQLPESCARRMKGSQEKGTMAYAALKSGSYTNLVLTKHGLGTFAPGIVVERECGDSGINWKEIAMKKRLAGYPQSKMEDYLGGGTFGAVYAIPKDKARQDKIALKIFHGTATAHIKEAITEAQIFSKLGQHPHIVKYLGVEFWPNFSLIGLELASGSLADWKEKRENSDLQSRTRQCKIFKFGEQIFNGLSHFHQNGFIHMDMKLGNVLLDEHDNITITDVGIAVGIEDGTFGYSALGSTMMYECPEFQKTSDSLERTFWNPELGGADWTRFRRVSAKCDVWSVGIMLLELLRRETDGFLKVINHIVRMNPDDKLYGLTPRRDELALPGNFWGRTDITSEAITDAMRQEKLEEYFGGVQIHKQELNDIATHLLAPNPNGRHDAKDAEQLMHRLKDQCTTQEQPKATEQIDAATTDGKTGATEIDAATT